MSVRVISWLDHVNSVNAYRNYLTQVIKRHVSVKFAKIFFPIFSYFLAEIYARIALLDTSSLEQSIPQRTRNQRRRVRCFCWEQLFAILFTSSPNFGVFIRSGSVNFSSFRRLQARTVHLNPKLMSSIPSSSASFLGADALQLGLATSKFFWEGHMFPSQTLLHETYRCSQIWPTRMSYGFIGVV